MAGAISINILSNVREAVRGVDDVADALEDAEGRMHDLTKEGDTAADRMEADFRQVSQAADRSSDQLRDKFRAAYRDVKRSSDDAADDAVRAQRRMSDQSAEVGQEIRQNLGEGIANAARGDFESLADTIGDTLGGAVSGIGGIGFAAVGAAGALGVGALIAAFQIAEEQRRKLEERANDLAQAYISAGSDVLDAMTISARSSEILTDKDLRKEAEELKRVLGTDLSTAVRALAGDQNALAAANEIVKSSEDELLRLMRESTDYMSGDFSAAEKARLDQLLDARQKVDDLNTVNGTANETFLTQQAILKGLVNEASSAVKEVDELGNAVYTLPDGAQIMIDAETGNATTDLSAFKGDVDGIPETVITTVKVRRDTSEWDNWTPRMKQGYVRANRLDQAV